ncbi:MAG: hypothetical protein GY769_10545 [bacterium]|nr:hypothetical protein [bacterium]
MALSLASFKLERAILELRFPAALTLWDRAGQVWTDAKRRWPDLEARKAEPGETIFRLRNELELSVGLQSLRIVAFFPSRKLKPLVEIAGGFVKPTLETLGVEILDRVGARFLYFQKHPDREHAAEAILATKLMRSPKGSHFGVEGDVAETEYVARIEEATKGVTVRLKVEGRKVDFVPPPNVSELKEFHRKEQGIVFDVDCYSTVEMTPSQLDPVEWIEQWNQTVKRGSDLFFGGE